MQAEAFTPSFTTMDESNQVGEIQYIAGIILLVIIVVAFCLCHWAIYHE